jgi:hypothetical protein
MSSRSAIASRLRAVFTVEASQLGHECGVIGRVHKFTGSSLAWTFVSGWLADSRRDAGRVGANGRLVPDVGFAASGRFPVRRLGRRFFRRLLEVATHEVITSAPSAAPLLDRFEGIYVQDSAVSALPDPLSRFWKACGDARGQSCAGVKLHGRLDLKRGGLEGPWLDDARASDHDNPPDRTPLTRGSAEPAARAADAPSGCRSSCMPSYWQWSGSIGCC